MILLQIQWDPISYIDLGFFKLHFYSLMWVIAFILGFFITKRIYRNENLSDQLLDSLFLYSVLGLLIGARLGHVIFYQSELFREDFFSIFLPFSFKNGFRFTGFQGLASHGAAIGMLVSMYLYNKKVLKKSLLWILDRVVIPIAMGSVFVRLGNFINSEINGKPTNSDYGIVFKQLDVNDQVARHPAQLYEALCYVFIFLILLHVYWKTKKAQQEGFIFGFFLVLLWSVRFGIEYVKVSQGGIEDYFGGILTTGQILSIPFIWTGLYFMFFRIKKNKG